MILSMFYPDRTHCASLRTLFAWCMKVLELYSYCDVLFLSDKYHLKDGKLSRTTQAQLDNLQGQA